VSGYPPTYFDALAAVEDDHWWHRGMRSIAAALLGGRIARGGPLLDAGCGTGGFLSWAAAQGFSPLAGIDVFGEAIDAARARIPTADLRVAPISELPFPDASFAVVACHDVLQHVDEELVVRSLEEVRRVLHADGALLLRTNGGWRPRRERPDWRRYDRRGLRATLASGGFRCERLAYVNCAGSLAALVRGSVPHAPTETSHGIPERPRGGGGARYGLLRAEATIVRLPRGTMPYGHTIVALAVKRS
jgi:SAM-dependent methyltransferase